MDLAWYSRSILAVEPSGGEPDLMSPDDNHRDELLRRFESVISGAELDDLRQLVGDLSLLGAAAAQERFQPERRELRRPSLADVRIFRVRVELRHSKPRIWRRLELRSDLTLDVVHRVLQTAFSWTDTHLWRFSLGGDPFSWGRSGVSVSVGFRGGRISG